MSVTEVESPTAKGGKTQIIKGQKTAKNKLSSKNKKPGKKQREPIKKALKKGAIEANKVARADIASGKVTVFSLPAAQPVYASVEQIQELHSDIKFVRAPRLSTKKGGEDGITYAFLEFSDEETCKSAKNRLATTQYQGKELYVDFVGVKSKNNKSDSDELEEVNPMRLFVVGLAPGVTQDNLKDMFPKAANAKIPQKSRKQGTSFGFVQFDNAGEAKAAFDAAQDLSVNGHKITVLYAKTSEKKKEDHKIKTKKRKVKENREDGSVEKKIKVVEENDAAEDETSEKETENKENSDEGVDDNVEEKDDNDEEKDDCDDEEEDE